MICIESNSGTYLLNLVVNFLLEQVDPSILLIELFLEAISKLVRQLPRIGNLSVDECNPIVVVGKGRHLTVEHLLVRLQAV